MPSDHQRYAEAIERCRANARATPRAEMQQLWVSIADTCRFLEEHDLRAEAEALARAGAAVAFSIERRQDQERACMSRCRFG
jgi:hypothetical protein